MCHFSKKIVFGINLWNVSCAYVNHCMHLWILKHFTQIAKYVDFTPHLLYSSGSYNRSQHAHANHIYYYFSSKLLTYICGSHSYFIWKYDRNVIKTSFSNKTSYLWYQPSLVSKLSLFKHCFHIPCMYSFKALFIIKPLCSGYFQWNVLSACCFFCNALQLQLTVNVFQIVLAAHRSSWKHPLTLIHYCRL